MNIFLIRTIIVLLFSLIAFELYLCVVENLSTYVTIISLCFGVFSKQVFTKKLPKFILIKAVDLIF